jgi:hypothetical protein
MDAYNNPGFYRQLGKDPEQLKAGALELLVKRFSLWGQAPELDVAEIAVATSRKDSAANSRKYPPRERISLTPA